MFGKSFAIFLLLVLILTFVGIMSVFGQDESCGLKIEVSRYEDETPISGATATAINTETKKVYKSILRKGMPFFAKLSEGEYKITVTKLGYKKSVDDYIVTCVQIENSVLTTSFPMWQGSSRQIVTVSDYIQLNVPVAVYNDSPSTKDDNYSVGETNGKPNTVSRIIEGGVLNGKATNLVKPEYPAAARAVQASGAVNVKITIDEQGNVISAAAASGHPLLRAAAVKAARESKFSPTFLSGQPVKVTGVIVYNFVP